MPVGDLSDNFHKTHIVMSEATIIEMPIPDTLEQAQALINKAREEQLARLRAADAEITEVCKKHNVQLSAMPIINNGGTKIPVKLDVGGLAMQIEIQLTDLASLPKPEAPKS